MSMRYWQIQSDMNYLYTEHRKNYFILSTIQHSLYSNNQKKLFYNLNNYFRSMQIYYNWIPKELIEKSLELTWKDMRDMTEIIWKEYEWEFIWVFSIEKYCYYLLSPEFIEKYKKIDDKSKTDWMHESYYVRCFAKAIYELQKWDAKHLIHLLSKI